MPTIPAGLRGSLVFNTENTARCNCDAKVRSSINMPVTDILAQQQPVNKGDALVFRQCASTFHSGH